MPTRLDTPMPRMNRAMRTTTFSSDDHIPESLKLFLARRASEIIGICLLAGSAGLALCLATWSVHDHSLTNATSAPTRNLLGFGGAVVSDLIMQLIGLGAVALLVPLTFWGWHFLTHRKLEHPKLRMALWLIGIATTAAIFSVLPATDRWPLPTGLGGLVGDKILSIPSALASGSRLAMLLMVLPLIGVALLTVSGASGFGFQEHRAEDEFDDLLPFDDQAEEEDTPASRPGLGIISIGAIIHGVLCLRSFVDQKWVRTLRDIKGQHAAEERVDPLVQPRRGSRVEPRFEPQPGAKSIQVQTRPSHPVDDAEDFEDERAGPKVTPPAAPLKPGKRTTREAQPSFLDRHAYALPALALLAEARKQAVSKISEDALEQNARLLEGVLDDFGVRGEIINVRPGPVVTLYELEPAPGIKSSRVIGLADDVARSMSAVSARVAVVQGRNVIGIELPNQKRETVYLRELLASEDFEKSKQKLAIALGKTIGGEPVIVDLARMPHLLVAGTTGSGKSVAINTMILSLLYRLTPQECRLIMVDPKMLELSVYDGIPHLLTPVVTDPKKAVVALKWAVREMEDRYKKMSRVGVRNIDGFNARVAEASAKGEIITRTVQTGYNRETGEAVYEQEELNLVALPYIVVIVDEMADLMLVAGKDIEGVIQRLAQMARAAGIHLIMATQRPSVDVITGTIKANFPTRISFQVTSKIDSRTILGEQGAEQLLGQGDMLYMAGGGRISRVHGPFVSDGEVEKIVAHLKTQGVPDYLESVTADDEAEGADGEGGDTSASGQYGDESGDLYDRAVAIVLRDRKCSTSYIQRRLSVGYNKAASLVERMEQEGVISAANHSGKREILVGGGIDRGAFDPDADD